MKILHVIPGLTFEQGGTAAVAQALASAHAEANHDVTLLTTNSGVRIGEQPLPLHQNVRKVEATVRGPDRVAFSRRFSSLARECLRQCDLAHVHSVFNYPTHAALKQSLALGTPVVLSPHGMLQSIMMRRTRLSYLKKAAYLLTYGWMLRRACSAWHFTSANERAASWPGASAQTFVQGLGVNPIEYDCDPSNARLAVIKRWPAIRNRPFVLFLGRLHPKKKPGFLVEAFLDGAPEPFCLVLAGPDEFGTWGSIQELLQRRGATDRVVATGPVAGQAKAELYSAAAFFALPSINENFGLTVLESLSAGTPVLSSPHVDLSLEAAEAGLAEILPLGLEAWRARFAKLALSDNDHGSFTEKARAWVRASYSWKAIAASFVQRYQWVLAGCP